MRNINNPRQKQLFDPFDTVLTQNCRKRLLEGWQGVFRHVILELMPVQKIAVHFHPVMGRPTKELYSIAGLMLIKEFMNWTKQQTVDEYSFNISVQYALNLEPVSHDMSVRTLERYIRLFESDDLAKSIMDTVTLKLIEILGVKIDKQRLDSTHIFSDMASFGRTRLMGVAVKRFLTQVKRHNGKDYDLLSESLRSRYEPGERRLFADCGKDNQSRRLLRQQVAEDMYELIRLFSSNPEHNSRNSFKYLERIFYQQCEVQEGDVVVKAKTGGDVMQNPSDPDATYDGHKGQGYQAQLTETCEPENAQQFITGAIVQTACHSDSQSVEAVFENLKENELLPEQMLADTAYCGDENVVFAEQCGVELVGPVPGKSGNDDEYECINIDDFNIDETSEQVLCCPSGNEPESSVHNQATGKTKTIMSSSACGNCEFFEQCPVNRCSGQYVLYHTAKDRRIAARRREQDTEVFGQRYRARGGIEGGISGVKRFTGLGRLRVRGFKAVSNATYLKLAGWNIRRAVCCAKIREIVSKRAQKAFLDVIFGFLSVIITVIEGLSALVGSNRLENREVSKQSHFKHCF